MSDDQTSAASPHRTQVWQAQAWLEIMRPDDAEVWENRAEIADLSGDDARYDELRRSIVAEWKNHRDDPHNAGTRHVLELAQSEAWLGDHAWSWKRAQALAVDRSEHEAGASTLIATWREHRDDTTVPEPLQARIDAILTAREARLSAAKEWLANRDPHAFFEWERRRAYADSFEGEWLDDGDLIRQHLTHLKAAPPPRTASQPPQQKATAKSTTRQGSRRRSVRSWLPWTTDSRPRNDRDPRSL